MIDEDSNKRPEYRLVDAGDMLLAEAEISKLRSQLAAANEKVKRYREALEGIANEPILDKCRFQKIAKQALDEGGAGK